MRQISAAQLDKLLLDANTIEEDGLGIKVARLTNGNYLKLYRRKSLISSDLWSLPAKRFADNANGLQQLGITAPHIVETLLINERRLSAVQYIPLPGDTFRNHLRNSGENGQSDAVERFGMFLGKLHESGVYFRSLHLGNVLQLPNNGFGLIDLSDMKLEGHSLPHWKRRRNLQHILRYPEDIEWLVHRHRDAWINGYMSMVSTKNLTRFVRDLAEWAPSGRN